ncbi:hemerythrin domain-containing protein [Actinoplanes oblitus]|uniref:Hemerythrin domain-containing protein n=1 Tax=Actinoplanes oblitus TaxID=3040509 RepID=A0ABY8W9U6_9ACTN|nr:hemerythrin domain-containing protein [Actinoplanes oblitus]WIM93164.1 hemerythrin domain-containing protein [Actinoplanes oblitus]
MAQSRERPDTNEMVIVHRVYRRELRLLPPLVLGVAAGDRARARELAEHCRFLTTALHHHHSDEDALLWPWLTGAAEVSAEVTERMQRQHDRAAALLTEVEQLAPRWAADADPAVRHELAQALTALHAVLVEHLDDEEANLLPLVTEYITVAQWSELSRRGRRSMPMRQGFVFLGLMLQDASPAERAGILAQMPAPVRFLFARMGLPAYRRYVNRIHHTVPGWVLSS